MSLTRAQYDELMREYAGRQHRNEEIVARRQAEVYEKLPELATLDDAAGSAASEGLKRMLAGENGASEKAKEKLREIETRRKKLLEGAGYPADYFEPPYTCKDCKDTGYIGNQKCHCFIQATIRIVYEQSHLDDVLQRENFSTFSFAYYSDKDEKNGTSPLQNAKDAYDKAQNFVHHFDEEHANLLLYGNPGTGKTFLTNCIAKELLDTGHSVLYFTAPELFHLFEDDVFHQNADAAELHAELFECDLLIIDDLGAEFGNTFTESQLFSCLNGRLLRKKSVIISTNLKLIQLRDTYSERISSRILGNFTLCNLFGADIRIAKR